MTHYFHTEDRDGAQLFFVSESSGEKSHTHTLHVTHTHAHTHTHLSNRTWLLSLLQHVSTRNKQRLLPLHSLLLSFTPPLLLPPQCFGQSVCTQERKSRHTHLCSSLPLPLAIALPLLLPSHTHRGRPAKLYTTRNLLSDPPPPRYCSTSVSLSTFPSSLNISPLCQQHPTQKTNQC